MSKTVRPTQQQIAAFMTGEHDGKPVAMLNMLKYREKAEYTPDYLAHHPEATGRSGREAYEIYSKQTMPFLFSVGGQLLWMSDVRSSLIGPAEETWDRIFLVYYPSRDALRKMLSNPAYQATGVHRDAALRDSRLIETRQVKVPRLSLIALRAFFRVKTLIFGGP